MQGRGAPADPALRLSPVLGQALAFNDAVRQSQIPRLRREFREFQSSLGPLTAEEANREVMSDYVPPPEPYDPSLIGRFGRGLNDTAKVFWNGAVSVGEGLVATAALSAIAGEAVSRKLGWSDERDARLSDHLLNGLNWIKENVREDLSWQDDPKNKDPYGVKQGFANVGETIVSFGVAGRLERLANRGSGKLAEKTAQEAADPFAGKIANPIERRAIDRAIAKTPPPAANATAQETRQYGANLAKEYGKALAVEQFKEGSKQASVAFFKPNFWSVTMAALNGTETYQAVMDNGGNVDKAAMEALGDAGTTYLLMNLISASGAFLMGASTTQATQAIAAFKRGSRHANLWQAIAGSAMRIGVGGGAMGASSWQHIERLQQAGVQITDEDQLGAAVASAVFGGATGALSSIIPLRRAIMADKLRALYEQGRGPLRGAEPGATPTGPQPLGGPAGTPPSGGNAAPSAAPHWAQIAATTNTGDVLFRDGSLYRARTGDFLMPNGAIVDAQGNVLTIAGPEATPATEAPNGAPEQQGRGAAPHQPANQPISQSANQPEGGEAAPSPAQPVDPGVRQHAQNLQQSAQSAFPPAPPAAAVLNLYQLLQRADVRVHNVPVSSLRVNFRIPQFKADANPVTGEVAGNELQGEYQRVPAKPIVVIQWADGTMEVATGRHRLGLARRNGLETIPANIIKESEGWSPKAAGLLDAIDNVLDEKGAIQDYLKLFRDAGIDRDTAQAKGLLARPLGRQAFDIAENASDDLYAIVMGKDKWVTADVAAAICREAPRSLGSYAESVQRAVARQVMDRRMGADDAAILARDLMHRRAQSDQARTIMQDDLFGADDTALLIMAEQAAYAADKRRAATKDLQRINAALQKGDALSLKGDFAKRMGITDPKDISQLQAAADRLRQTIADWEHYYLNPTLSAEANAKAREILGLEALPVLTESGNVQTAAEAGVDIRPQTPAAEPQDDLTDSLFSPTAPDDGASLGSPTTPGGEAAQPAAVKQSKREAREAQRARMVTTHDLGLGGLTDEESNGPDFTPLAEGENFDSIRTAVDTMRKGETSVSDVFGIRYKVKSGRDAGKTANYTKEGEDARAHQYAAKNVIQLAKRAGVAVRQDNYKPNSPNKTYVRLFAPYFFENRLYIAVIAQYEADVNGVHAVEALDVIRADVNPEVISRDPLAGLAPTGTQSALDTISIPQKGLTVNELSLESIQRVIDNPKKGGNQRPRLLDPDGNGGLTETPCTAQDVAGRILTDIDAFVRRAKTIAKHRMQPGQELGTYTLANAPIHVALQEGRAIVTGLANIPQSQVADVLTALDAQLGPTLPILTSDNPAPLVQNLIQARNSRAEAHTLRTALDTGAVKLARGPKGIRVEGVQAPSAKDVFTMDDAQIDALAALGDKVDANPAWINAPWENPALGQIVRKAQAARERRKADTDPHWYRALPWERKAQRAVTQNRSRMGRGTDNIKTPERQALRRDIAQKLYNGGSAQKGRQLFIVMGLPGSGKSSAVVKNLKAEVGDLVEVDADEAKTFLPEFNGGKNADMVHAESGLIAEYFLLRDLCFANGDNVVFPTVGKNAQKLEHLILEAKSHGYSVYLYNVRIPVAESAYRALRRFVETGRFVPPDYIVDGVGTKPDETFAILKNRKDLIDGYADLSNDVPFGSRPQTLETSDRPPAGLGQRGLSVHVGPGQGVPDQAAGAGADGQGSGGRNGVVTLANPAPEAQGRGEAPRQESQASKPPSLQTSAGAGARAIIPPERIVGGVRVLATRVYPMNGQIVGRLGPLGGTDGSPARTFGRKSLTTFDLALLYRDLTGGELPTVVHNRAQMGKALGRYYVGQNKIRIAAQIFGLVDESDIRALHDTLAKHGFFLHERPEWAATKTKKQLQAQKEVSEKALERELQKLLKRRIRSGAEPGLPAPKVLAHELWHLIDDQDGGLVGRGNLVGHLAALKRYTADAFPIAGFAGNTQLKAEAKAFITWWRGIGKDEPYFEKPEEMYAEIGAAYFCAPSVLQERAPNCYAAWDHAIQNHPQAAKAYRDACTYIAAGGRPALIHKTLAETWGREHDQALRRLNQAVQGFDNSLTAWRRRIVAALWDDRGPALDLVRKAYKDRLAEIQEVRRKGAANDLTLKLQERRLKNILDKARLSHVLYRRKGPNNARLYLADVKGEFLERLADIDPNTDVARQQVELYATYHRIIELDGRAAAYGLDPIRARNQLADMHKTLGDDTFRKVVRAWNVFRALYERDVIERPATTELLGKDFVELMRKNVHYVTAHRTVTPQRLQALLDGLENGQGGALELAAEQLIKRSGEDTDVGNFLKEYKGSLNPTKNPLLETIKTAVSIITLAERNQTVLDWVRALRALRSDEVQERPYAQRVQNNRVGYVEFYENGVRKVLIVPRSVAAGFERVDSTWLKAITHTTRVINAALTTNNYGFIPIAQMRDFASAVYNTPGLHRWAPHWIPALGDLAALGAQFVPPAALRAIAQHPIGKLLINQNTIEYWAAYGNRAARLIHSGDFQGELERARQDRLNGNEASARDREFIVQMARQALRDGVLLSMVQLRKQDYNESEWRTLFARYNLDFDDIPPSESLPAKIVKAPLRAGAAYWNGAGALSELASATTKLAAYCYLHQDALRPGAITPDNRPAPYLSSHAASRLYQDATPDSPSFTALQDIANAFRAAVLAGDPTFDIRGYLMTYFEWITGPFLNARIKGTFRIFQTLLDDAPRSRRLDGKRPTSTKLGHTAEYAAKISAMLFSRTLFWAVTGGAATTAVLALYRYLTNNPDATPQDMQGTPLGALHDTLDWIARANKNISPYLLQNYNNLPLATFGDVTLHLAVPIADEEKILIRLFDACLNAMNPDWSPNPATGPADVTSELFSTIANSPESRGTLANLAMPLVPWLFQTNPYDPFRQTTLLTDEEFAARWTNPAAIKTASGRLIDSTPLALILKSTPNTTPERQAALNQAGWLHDFHDTLTRTPIISSVAGRFLRVSVGGETDRRRKRQQLDQQQVLAVRLLAKQNAAKYTAGQPLQEPDIDPVYMPDYIKAFLNALQDQPSPATLPLARLQELRSTLRIRDPRLREQNLRSLQSTP